MKPPIFIIIFTLGDSIFSGLCWLSAFLFSFLRKNQVISSWNFANEMKTTTMHALDIAKA